MMSAVELVPGVPTLDAERVEHDDRPAVGTWWWVRANKKTDDDECDLGRKWLGCIIEIGSNYVELQGVRFHKRVSIDDLHAKCEPCPEYQTFIDTKLDEHRGNVRQLMGEIKRVCAQLGVPMHQALAEAESGAQALAVTSGVADAKAYGEALALAKKETLPELFKLVKEQHEHLATWMKAELIPAKAELERAKGVTKIIESKIHTVELYAGLQEKLVQVKEGEAAPVDTKVHLLQRRCYMDEECLARYEAGGMDFKDIEAFDKWISRDENMTRILPHERCIVAFRVRRNDKRYGGDTDTLANFIKFWSYNEHNKQTFLYIRNGRQLWRMSTSLSFGAELFPRREDSDLLADGRLYRSTHSNPVQFISGRCYDSKVITYHEERARLARELWEWKRQGKPEGQWIMPGDERSTWSSVDGKSIKGRRYGRPDDYPSADHENYVLVTPEDIYHDDAMREAKEEAAEHNRIAVIIQGLLDRSTCLHPHPPWKLWTPEGFERAIELVYDASLVIAPGEALDWEAYRAQLNKSLRPGAVTIGQREAWRAEMEETHGSERSYDWPAHVGRGPKHIDIVGDVRGGKLRYDFMRERRRAKWVPADRPGYIKRSYPDIPVHWWCSKEAVAEYVTCIDAYTPGDFHLFFDDVRTRGLYLEWAPILLAAEDYHHERRTAPSTPTNDEEVASGDDE